MSDETWVVTLPKLGESVTEGVIGTFFKNVGDEVEFDDPLFEVSTDKVDTEVPSSYDGVVLEVMAQAGDTVSVGAAIMRIGGKVPPWRTDSRPPRTGWPPQADDHSTIPPRRRWVARRARRPRPPTSRRHRRGRDLRGHHAQTG
jgi:2-oxoglutarate dehydrogenase E2 component (dihydrolipoamide succinyltransferase)